MGYQSVPEGRIRAALFVDFDNIYISLKKYDEDAAEAFARAPELWLEWLEKKLDTGGRGKRTILLRRCYLNPNSFYRIRNNFVKAGFQVVDCPSFTTRNKNGADILMVIDILDALNHETRFDEFIILSGDSDFRPLILRLRSHDRRSIIVQIGAVAPAYTAACDYVVEEDEFIEEMLGVRESRAAGNGHRASAPPSAPAAKIDAQPPSRFGKTLEQVADKLLELVNTDGDILGSDLPRVYKQFPEFRDSHWFGFRSLRRLTEHIVSLREDLHFFDEEDGNWFIGLEEPVAAEEGGDDSGDSAETETDTDQLGVDIIEFVEDEVQRSEKPIHMATVAHRLKRKFGDAIFKTNWAGAGSFRNLLDEFNDKKFAIANVKSGVLYNPDRHAEPKEISLDDLLEKQPEALRTFIPRISKATGGVVPTLMPREYEALFQAIADEVSENGFSLFHTAKAVQDRYVEFENTQKEELRDVSLKAIRNILKGIAIQNRELFDTPEEGVEDAEEHQGVAVEDLVSAYRENVITLCEQAEESVDDEDMELLEEWIGGAETPA